MMYSETSTKPTLEQSVGQMLLVSFEGYTVPESMRALLKRRHVGGVTLFRAKNVQSPVQVRALTTSLQAVAAESGQPPLLICADQEGGTLLAVAGTTAFPGNMALGATRSPDLARWVGYAIGRELAAMGINVNYAPVCDVNVNPRNPVIGPRSFGEDPALVASLAAAMVEGLQEAGVAATAKHFPGHGDTSTDSHHSTPVLPFNEERLERIELPPFASAISAGARLVMSAHIALPHLTGGEPVPATMSAAIMKGLLRDRLGFRGVAVSDAMDMGGILQGQGLQAASITAAAAGIDLFILTDSGQAMESVYTALLQAASTGKLSREEIEASARRVLELKAWASRQQVPGLDVVRCEEHLALAREVAERAVTLVRDTAGLLPLRLSPEERVLAIAPRPADLTPADTSSYEIPQLAAALRRHHPTVDEMLVPLEPSPDGIGEIRRRAAEYDLVVVGTINAVDHPAQAELVSALLDTGTRVVTVALRLPYDIQGYPAAPIFTCTYSLQPPSLDALADALWGRIPFSGKLPVTVAGS